MIFCHTAKFRSREFCQLALAKSGATASYGHMANARLKSARKTAGLSLESLSEIVGISVSQLSRFESGKREPRVAEIQRIADALGVDSSSLLPDAEVRTVPLVGFVGAGATANLFAEGQGPFDEVEAPEGATDQTVAVEIRGESLGALFDQWLVFYDDVHDPPTGRLLRKLCVVGLPDGRVLVKRLERGQLPGRFNLLSNTEPPIYDVDVEWAAQVRAMTPR